MEIPITTKIKLIIAAILTILLGIFLFLNMQTIEVNFIIGKVEIRRSVMILCTFVIGLFAGWTLKSFLTFKKSN